MRRAGLGRYAGVSGDRTGDPLDGLVNLFDLAIVLAVGFLLAALGSLGLEGVLTREQDPERVREAVRQGVSEDAVPLPGVPAGSATAEGQGTPVGTVYQLNDGRIVYVERKGSGAGGQQRSAGPPRSGAAPAPPAPRPSSPPSAQRSPSLTAPGRASPGGASAPRAPDRSGSRSSGSGGVEVEPGPGLSAP